MGCHREVVDCYITTQPSWMFCQQRHYRCPLLLKLHLVIRNVSISQGFNYSWKNFELFHFPESGLTNWKCDRGKRRLTKLYFSFFFSDLKSIFESQLLHLNIDRSKLNEIIYKRLIKGPASVELGSDRKHLRITLN